MSVLLRDRRGPVEVLTLNRPERRNALSVELMSALERALTELATDEQVRAVVVTGADPAWCAGLDLHEVASGQGALGSGEAVARLLGGLPQPTIAAVNGPAVTGGLELCLLCDLRIGSERARFADTHARIGIHPGWGLTVTLPRIVGTARAREMSYTGNYVDAAEALRWGLISRVVPHESLVDEAVALADAAASVDQDVLRALQALYDATDDGVAGATAREQAGWASWRSRDDTASRVAERKDAVMARGRDQARRRGAAT